MKKYVILAIILCFGQTAQAQRRFNSRYYLNPFYESWADKSSDLSDKSDYLHRKWELDQELRSHNAETLARRRAKNEEYNRTHPPKYTFTYEGVEYPNFNEFMKSEAGQKIKFEQEMKTLDQQYAKEADEIRHQHNIREIQEWRSARYPDVYRLRDERVQQLTRQAMGDAWWKQQEEPQIYNPQSPSYQVVNKIAQKYHISQREAWENHGEEISREFERILPKGSVSRVMPFKPIGRNPF